MEKKITRDDIDRQYHLRRSDPEKFLELTNRLVEQNPGDSGAYFVRHQAWTRLDCMDMALADVDRALAIEEDSTTHEARGRALHCLGRYQEALAAYDRAEQVSPSDWQDGFGALFRADCHARLGNEAAALADCATLREDHWTPGLFGAPAGNRAEVAVELRCRAAAACQQRT